MAILAGLEGMDGEEDTAVREADALVQVNRGIGTGDGEEKPCSIDTARRDSHSLVNLLV